MQRLRPVRFRPWIVQRQDPAFSQLRTETTHLLRTEATHLLSTLNHLYLKGLAKWETTAPWHHPPT